MIGNITNHNSTNMYSAKPQI